MMEVFAQQSFRQRSLFDVAKVRRLLENFPNMKNNKIKEYRKILLWRIFTFEMWAQMFLDKQIETYHN